MRTLLQSIAGTSARLRRSLWAVRPLQIADDSPWALTIESRRGNFVADIGERTLSRNGRVLASFAEIQSVDVVPEGMGGFEGRWGIWAQMGSLGRVKIGDTDDDVHASVVAARLWAVVGRKATARRKLFLPSY